MCVQVYMSKLCAQRKSHPSLFFEVRSLTTGGVYLADYIANIRKPSIIASQGRDYRCKQLCQVLPLNIYFILYV